jgi:hypothetical protein
MTAPDTEIAGMFVQGRGTQRSIVAGAAGGVIGAIAASRGRTGGPLRVRQVGYLSVRGDQLILFEGKYRAMLGGFKALDGVVATAPRTSVAGAWWEMGRVGGVFEVAFTDGSLWEFDVPKVGNKLASRAADALGAAHR